MPIRMNPLVFLVLQTPFALTELRQSWQLWSLSGLGFHFDWLFSDGNSEIFKFILTEFRCVGPTLRATSGKPGRCSLHHLCLWLVVCFLTPFPQVDIIWAVVIVWRARGKTIRSVLYNIVCNNCAQYNTHIWTDLTVLWIGFCLTGPISLCSDTFVYCVSLYIVCMCRFVTRWGVPGGIEASS